MPSTATVLVARSSAIACVAAAAGSVGAVRSGWAPAGRLTTVRSSEFQAQWVVPSETRVRSPESVGSATRPRWLPPDQIRAVLVPFAAWGACGSAGSPRLLFSSTVPLNGPGSAAVSTELTRSSGATGGSCGWAYAPPATATSPSPTAPTMPMVAAMRTVLRPAMGTA